MSDEVVEALWRRGHLRYKLHAKQKELYDILRSSEEDETVLASRRWGKSFLFATFASEEAIRNPNSKVILIAPDKAQAYEIYTPIMVALSQDAPKGFVRPTKSESKWRVDNSELIFAGFDTVAESLRGKGSILIIFDEAGFVNADIYEYTTKSIIYPILQKTIGKKKGRKMWVSTPAKLPDHPFNVHWEAVQKTGRLHTYTIYDNPILSQQDIQEIIDEQGGSDSIGFRREYLCQNVRDTGGLIIPKFEEHRHVLDSLKGIDVFPYCWIAGDTGGIRDKYVFQVLGRRIQDNKIIVLADREFPRNTDTITLGDCIKELKNLYGIKDFHVWVDAPSQTLIDFYKLCGLTVSLPPKQDRDSAIAALNAAFFRDEMLVSSDCVFTVGSLNNCSFNKNRTDFLRSEKWGHADAIMTAVYGYRVAHLVTQPKLIGGSSRQVITLRRPGNENSYKEIAKQLHPVSVTWQRR